MVDIFKYSDIGSEESEWCLVMRCWKSTAIADWARRSWRPPDGMLMRLVGTGIERLKERGANFPCVRFCKNEDQIFAFACIEDDVAHFVYVKKGFRRRGLAKKLLEGVKYATFCPSNKERFLKRMNIRRVDSW